MMTDRQKRIQQLAHMKHYLAKLSLLLMRQVAAAELLSLVETKARADQKVGPEIKSIKVPLEWLSSSTFDLFIRELARRDSSSVTLWLCEAHICGAIDVRSLADIDFRLAFDALPEGILTVTTRSMKEKMLLDFHEDGGARYVDIELSGAAWPSVSISPPVPGSRAVQ